MYKDLSLELFNNITKEKIRILLDDSAPLMDLEEYWNKKSNFIDEAKRNLKDFSYPDEITLEYEPKEEQGVVALFHQLVGAGYLPFYYPMRATVFHKYDEVCKYFVPSDQTDKLGKHYAQKYDEQDFEKEVIIEFKKTGLDIIDDFDKKNKIAKFIDILICWEIGNDKIGYFTNAEDQKQDIRHIGTTHFLRRSNELIPSNDKISVIAIKDFVEKIKNR